MIEVGKNMKVTFLLDEKKVTKKMKLREKIDDYTLTKDEKSKGKFLLVFENLSNSLKERVLIYEDEIVEYSLLS